MLGTRSGCPQELVLNEESLDFPVSDLQTARSEIFNLPVTAFYFLCGKQSENSSGYFLFSHTHTLTHRHSAHFRYSCFKLKANNPMSGVIFITGFVSFHII